MREGDLTKWIGWNVAYHVGEFGPTDALGSPCILTGVVIEAFPTGYVKVGDGFGSTMVEMDYLLPVVRNQWELQPALRLWQDLPRPTRV